MEKIQHWMTNLLKIEKSYKTKHEWFNWVVFSICMGWGGFQIWTFMFPLPAFYQRNLHMLFAYLLIFATVGWDRTKSGEHKIRPTGVVLAVLTISCITYACLGWKTKAYTRGMELSWDEMLLGWIFIFLTIEVCRRSVGWTLPIICGLMIFYARWGSLLPEVLAHRDYSFERMVTSFFISLDGIFGFLAHVSTSFIFVFVMFGSFLRVSGGGEFFIKTAMCLCGRMRGGPAKIAVVASTFFGCVSGSAMANVAGTGQFTIPLMKRAGYSPVFAGAVETTASAGGQIMPPVLGGAAFIMMEILNISYIAVMKHILLIAILFYAAIFIMVDIEAQKRNIRPLSNQEIPRLKECMKEGWFFLIPPIFLLFLLAFVRYSVTLSGFYAAVSIIPVSWLGRDSRMWVKEILLGLQETCYTFAPIAAILACAGLLVGLINMTGLGLMLSGMLVKLAHQNLFVLLALTAITSIILGMGVPTSAAYIILAVLVAPAMIQMNVIPVSAHLFIFYFAVMAVITPPFAPDAFVAAGISGANPMSTAVQACKIGAIGLLLPFAIIYSPTLIMIGSPLKILMSLITAIVGILALGSGISGFLFRPMSILRRVLSITAAVLMIWPEYYSDLLGVALFFFVCWFQRPGFHYELAQKYLFKRKQPQALSEFHYKD